MTATAQLKDEDLINALRKGDTRAATILFDRYGSMIEKIASCFFVEGAEKEDLLQEGYIGFLEAVRDFKEGKMPFGKFAYYCVKKNIYDLIQQQNRKKRKASQTTLSLEQLQNVDDPGNRIRIIDQIFYKKDSSPEDQVMIRFLVQEIVVLLTPLEKMALKNYLDGKDFATVAEEKNMEVKQIENALQRARSKIKNFLLEQLKA